MLQIGPYPVMSNNALNVVLSAAGTLQSTATLLTGETNFVTGGSGGVVLAGQSAGNNYSSSISTQAFKAQKVVNTTGSAVSVYPPNGFGAAFVSSNGTTYSTNAAYSLASGAEATFYPTSLTRYYVTA
jgi:hypothetical protein